MMIKQAVASPNNRNNSNSSREPEQILGSLTAGKLSRHRAKIRFSIGFRVSLVTWGPVAGVRIRVRAYYRQSEMFFSSLIVRAVALTTVVAAVNQY